jgi:hypothetical protein
MATRKNRAKAESGSKRGASSANRIKDLSNSSAGIVREAFALLDQEVSAGIVAAKQMQRRFQKERRVDPGDFTEALDKFQGDAHQIVSTLNDRFGELGSDQNSRLVKRLVNNTHDVLDLAVEMVSVGAEIADQLARSNLKPNGKSRDKRGR